MAAITPHNPFDQPANVRVASNASLVSAKPAAAMNNNGAQTELPLPPTATIPMNNMPVLGSQNISPAPVSEKPAAAMNIATNNNAARPFASTTPPRQKNNLGLSELSKQLRALQAKNEGQAVEIDRLERQLRILADLQGISVANLRRALSDACESEAYGELQNRVAALRAQLEAASLAKQQTVEQNAAAHQVATLQLRVGELEEADQDLRSQVKGLFDSLKDQTAKASRFETTCKQQELEIQRLKQELENAQQVQQRAPLIPAPPREIVPAMTTAVAAPPATPPQSLQLVPAPTSAIVASPADMELLMESAKAKLTVSEQQLEATEKQQKLRQAQFKARSMVQEERISDLEQQLNSLYVAFEMLRQEHSEEEATRAALQTSLNDADSRVAQQVNDSHRPSSPHVEAVPIPASPDFVRASPHGGTPSFDYVEASPVGMPAESRHSMASHSSHLMTPVSHQASLASQSQSPMREDCILMGGVLLIKSSNLLRPWKKKHATLYQGISQSQLVISDALQVKQDKTYTLEVGITALHRYGTQRFGFIIRIDPQDKEAPVIFAAATNEKEYIQWMSALQTATTGDEYNPHDYNIGFGESHMLPASTDAASIQAADDQEAKDLEIALRLSTQQM